MDRIIQQISQSERTLIASHADPDGDAVGSLIALGLALEKLGKETLLYNPSPIPAVYRFLPQVERIDSSLENMAAFDTAIVLDCGDLTRTGCAGPIIEQLPMVINIDHHISNSCFGHLQMVDTAACATAEIVYGLIKALGVAIDTDMATAIYTAILTDTGSFRFANTNPAAFAISQEMTALGVAPYRVARHVYGTYSLGRIRLLNLALDSIEISENGKLSMMTITNSMLSNTGTHPEDVDGLINYARRIKDVKVATLIQEQRNGSEDPDLPATYHVSLRSDGTVNVAAIASAFGGGGHYSAAGFQIQCPLSDLKAEIKTLSAKI
jgi:phosphoesterase RecJ-like protein